MVVGMGIVNISSSNDGGERYLQGGLVVIGGCINNAGGSTRW